MNRTKIQWTDFSSSPIRYRDRETGAPVWACVKVSAGCANCYAEALAERFHRGGPFTVGQMAKVEPYVDEKELGQMLRSKAISDVLKSMEQDAVDKMAGRFTDSLKAYGKGTLTLEEATGELTASLGDVAKWKARQVALSEVNQGANWASIQVIKETNQAWDAYFLVDNLSCETCQEWAAQNPYTVLQAESLGLPHPNCNDFWSFIPQGGGE